MDSRAVTTWFAEGGQPALANILETMRKGVPALLTASCVLVGLQAASVLTFAAIGLTLTSSQRMWMDQVVGGGEGPSILTLSIGAGALGLSLTGLIVIIARRVRLGR